MIHAIVIIAAMFVAFVTAPPDPICTLMYGIYFVAVFESGLLVLKSRPQFGLRTLLVVVSVACVFFAIVVSFGSLFGVFFLWCLAFSLVILGVRSHLSDKRKRCFSIAALLLSLSAIAFIPFL